MFVVGLLLIVSDVSVWLFFWYSYSVLLVVGSVFVKVVSLVVICCLKKVLKF